MIQRLTKRTKIILISVAALCVVVVLIVGWRYMISSQPATLAPGPTVSSSPSSSQQSVDTGLSLGVGSSAPAAPPTPVPVKPNPVYAGCKLSLTFNQTAGNLLAAGGMQYLLTAQNLGNTTCISASISAYYATNETFSSASPAPKDGYYWVLGNLAHGAHIPIMLTTNRSAPLGAGDVTNEACLSASNGTDACSNSSAGAAVASAPSGGAAPQPAAIALTALPQSSREAGVWVWTSLSDMSQADMANVVNEASAAGFNTIYITVDQYIAITQIQNDAARAAALQSYSAAAEEFLTLATAKNIAVDAEAGAQNWSENPNRSNAPLIMLFVASFNLAHNVKFRGVQYDIEPYLLPQYNANESGVLTDYVTLAESLAMQAGGDHVPLTLVLPHFYDSQIAWTPQITVDGVTAYPFDQILRVLAPDPGARVIIMAYRNFAAGSDSTIALAQAEVSGADKTNVKVLVAQETGPVTPSYVTFANLSKSALFTQIGAINSAFGNDKSFAGIAVDYLDPFEQLPN